MGQTYMSVAKQQEKSTQTEAKPVFEVGGARHKKQKDLGLQT
jgi:hypothetical protein